MATEKTLDGKPYAGNPHVAFSQCYGVADRFDDVETASATPSRRILSCKKMMQGAFLLTTYALAIGQPCLAMEPRRVVVPEKTEVEFWDRNKLIGTSKYPVGQMYCDGWLAGKVIYDSGPGIPTITSPYSDDEPTYGTKRTHHFFNGWQSDGKRIHSYDIVDPSVTRFESLWVEVDGEKTYYSVGASIRACGLATGNGPSYNPDNVTVQSMSANATLYRGSVDYNGDIDKDALDDFLAAQDDGSSGDIVVWLSGSVSCHQYRKDPYKDNNGNIVNMYDWKDAVPCDPDGPCTFDVGLVVTTASGHQWERINLGTVTISSGFYGFNYASSASFQIRHTLPKSLFIRGESYQLNYEFNCSHSLRTPTYPSTTAISLGTRFPGTVIGNSPRGGFDVWVDSADAAAGSLTLKWNPPEFMNLRTGEPLDKAKTDRILAGATYSIYRSRGNENWKDEARVNVNDTTKDGSDEFAGDLECVEDSWSGTTFPDTTFGTLGGNRPIHYVVVLNGGPMDARRNDTLPFLYGTAFGKVIARHRHSISLGLSEYDTRSADSDWKKKPPEKNLNAASESSTFTRLISNEDYDNVSVGYDDPEKSNSLHVSLGNSGCTKQEVAGQFVELATHPNLKPGDDVFLFIVTHGNTDELALYDKRWNIQEIKDCVGRFRGKGVRFIGIIEACHSGGIAKAFESDDFGFTTWVTAARRDEFSCYFDNASGFGRVFLENGWKKGHAKLQRVFSRNDRQQDTGATDSDNYLTLANLANYTDLIWTGFSTKKRTDGGTITSYEQHVERVRPEMQDRIVLRSVARESLSSTESVAPVLKAYFNDYSHPEINGVEDLQSLIGGLSSVEINNAAGSIFKLKYSDESNGWCVNRTKSASHTLSFYTPYQFRVLFGSGITDGTVSFSESAKEKSYKMHFLEPGKIYNVTGRILTPQGWGKESNSVELRMPRDEEWFTAQVKDDRIRAQAEVLLRGWGLQGEALSPRTNARNLLGSGNGWQNDIPEDVTLQFSVGIYKTSDGLRANFMVWEPSYNYDWHGFTVNGEWDYDPPPAVVVLDEKTGVATCDFGEVTGHLVYHSGDYDDDYDDYYEDYDNPINIDGRLVLTISTAGFTGKWGDLEFGGEVYVDTSDVEDMDQLRKEYFPFVLPDGDGAAPKDWCVLTYMPNGGCGLMEDQISDIGKTTTLSSNQYTKADCEFLGWAIRPTGDVLYSDGQDITLDGDMTLYAKWRFIGVNRYTVMFNINGGVGIDERYKFVNDGAAVGALPTPTWEGHAFLGWFTKPIGGDRISEGTLITGDVIYYAHWVHIVTFEPQIYHWDGGIEAAIIREVESGQPVGELPVLSWDDVYVSGFLGWFTGYDDGTEISASTIVTSDITYYAHWDYTGPDDDDDPFTYECEVTFDANGGYCPETNRFVEAGKAIGALPTPVLNGYKFLGWFDYPEDGWKISFTTKIYMDETYYAYWEYDGSAMVTVAVAEGCEAMGSVTGGNAAFKAGAKVSLKATANKGYVFSRWERAGNGEQGTGNELLSQAASFTYVATGEPVTIVAVFASSGDDAESLKVEVADDVTTEEDGSLSLNLGEYVESLSQPKLTVSGLPAGLKYDAKTGVIFGKATKPGVYVVKVSATNASATGKNAVVKEFTIKVPNLTSELFTAAGLKSEESYVLQAGIAPDLKGVVAAVTDDDWKLAVSGLPSGIKYDAKKGEFTGIASKEGFFTVYFTATRGKGKTAEKQVATATFEVVFQEVALSMAAWDDVSATNKCKVAGGGRYPFGKKVTVKATANKGSVFMGWEKSGNGEQGTGNGFVSQAASWSFEMPSNDLEYVAKFVTAAEDKASIDAAVDGWQLDPWVSKTETHAFATNIWAGVYLEWPVAASALSETKVKVAGLPSGLKFTDKPVTSKIGTGSNAVTVTNVLANTIYGAPTAASKVDSKTKAVKPSEVKVTVTTAGKSSQTYQIDTVVDALPAWAQGTFAGGGFVETALPAGQVSLTVSAAGKVSGKALGDGLTYTLAAPYYSGFALADDGGGIYSNFFADVTASWSYKEGTKTIKTNDVVQLVVQDNDIGGVATTGGGFVETALPEWTAWQYNWKADPWKDVGKKLDKQTRTYAILSDGSFSEEDEDLSAALGADVVGRVTLKFAATGAVTIAGEFVTGYDEKKEKYTIVKASGSATLVPVDNEHGEVFVYLTPKGLSPHARCVTLPWPKE